MPTMSRAGYTPPMKEQPPKPPKKYTKKKKHKKKKRGMSTVAVVSLVIFLIAVLIGSATLFLYAQTEPYVNTFSPGTSLSGYPLSGASPEDAKALLDKLTEEAIADWTCTLTWGENTYTLTAEEVSLQVDAAKTLDPVWQIAREGSFLTRYLAMLAARANPVDAVPVIVYDMTAADELLEQIKQDVTCAPVDATVTFTPGSSEPFRFTPESIGLTLDTAPLRAELENAMAGVKPFTRAVEPTKIEPNLYQVEFENAMEMRARVVLTLDADEAGFTNAKLAAEALHGLRVEDGEVLSFNEKVGRRTAEAGYVEAAEPAYGVNVSGVGGGICQVSTALYQAALLAELPVEAHSAAASPVSYAPMGQEAAVSDQGLDLKIKNDTGMPLFVTARAYTANETKKLEIVLIGVPLSKRCTLETQAEEISAPEEPVYVRDSEGRFAVYEDERVPGDAAKPGYAVKVERVFWEDGEEAGRELISENEYPPVPAIVYVGAQKR